MKEETTITFLAAECGEFHGMGECIECTSLKEAFRHYQRFCKRSPQMLPSLEFSLHHAEDPLYNEGEYPLVTGEKGKELLSYVPYYANHPLVQEAVRELSVLLWPCHVFLLSRDGRAITLRLFYRSQIAHLKNVQQPRVWGSRIPIKIAR